MKKTGNKILLGTDKRSLKLMRGLFAACFIMLIITSFNANAQVITNTGATISVSSSAVVKSKDLENTTGSVGNNGTFNLTGNLNNSGSLNFNGTINLTGNFNNTASGISGGNGFFNLIGNWTNNGAFNPGTSTVTFNGTTNQIITHGSSGENFYKLTIVNPGNYVTQVSASVGSLTVNNDLTITSGSLILGTTTSNLTIGGVATINGNLTYNSSRTQTTTVAGNLGGAGTLDMTGGSLPHSLFLAGSTNSIGTFLTNPASSSTVNYNGTIQTVFPALNYINLTISNSGIKTLQGNSTVGKRLNISGGTLDLGTTTTIFSVLNSTTINGSLKFDGTSVKLVSLNDSLVGSGSVDMSGGNLSHRITLNGAINYIGTYSSGLSSTVDYILNGNQTVFATDDYRNLRILGSGMKTLLGDVTTKGVLTMSAGDIQANSYTVKVTDGASGAINRTAGKIIGKLQRTIGVTGTDYLYPIGSSSNYNPMKFNSRNTVPGPITAHFNASDIGNIGPPLNDYDEQIYDRFTDGYWTLTSAASMSSSNFDVNLNTTGFIGVDLSSRIIKRTDGVTFEIDGKNDTLSVLPEMKRDSLLKGISTLTTDLAIGKGRPRITAQPSNLDICEGSNADFIVTATGRGTLSYRWQVDTGFGFTNIFDGPIGNGASYLRTDKRNLRILSAPYGMNGYLYRVKITDAQGNYNYTDPVLLTVNKIPAAISNILAQAECPGVAFSDIVLSTSNSVTGTTFTWTRDNPVGLTTSLPLTDLAPGGVISGIFSNTTDAPIPVTFTIIPKGPLTTYCIGSSINVGVTVNPIPKILPISTSTQCDSTNTSLQLNSPSIFTSGLISFKYSVTSTGSVSGYSTPVSGIANHFTVTDRLRNNTNVFQVVTYNVVPVSPVGCVDGPFTDIKVNVNPTPKSRPVNLYNFKSDSAICYSGTTDVLLTTPTVMTSGNIVFDYTVSTSGSGFVTGNFTSRTGKVPGDTISRSYRNSADTLYSVYFSITPRVDNAMCNHGPAAVSSIKVHPIPLRNLLNTKPLTCKTGGAGLAELLAVISKGANPYHINWTGPVGYTNVDSFRIRNLSAGRYVARVTDNLGCFFKDSILVSPVAATANITAPTIPPGNYNISCIGSTDGTILVFVTGGITPPYNYWFVRNSTDTLGSGIFSGNYNTFDPTTYKYYYGIGAGTYTLITRDVNGCYDSKSLAMRVPPPMVVTFGKSTFGSFNVPCKGYSNGSAWILNTTGGRGSYTYRWYTYNGHLLPSQVNAIRIDSLTAGKYYLETKDILGCVKIDSVIITEPNGMALAGYQLSKSADNNYNVSCYGGNNGAINMTITGGSGIYLFNWTGPNGFNATSKNISGLPSGTYNVTVQDFYGCVLLPSPSFILTQPTKLAVSAVKSVAIDGINNINCNGSGSGSITLNVSGGSTNNYYYLWSTAGGSGLVAGQKNQSGITAGDYKVVVSDLNTCKDSVNVTLIQPQAISTQLVAKQITCSSPGFNNGAVTLNVAGGTGTYTYSWSNGFNTQNISGLVQALYKVRVTDSNNCIKRDSVQIINPPAITYSTNIPAHNTFNISCFGLSDGSIQITPLTGKPPYSFTWTGPNSYSSANPSLSGLIAGQYNMQITDSNLCAAAGTFTLTQPGKLSMTVATSSSDHGPFNLNCAGDSTGTINITPVNGVGTMNYLWSDGSTSKTRAKLKAGNYGIIISDQNNCAADSSIILKQPDSLKVSAYVREAFCPDSPDGEIVLSVKGGVKVSDYTYHWSDNVTTSDRSNVGKGLYIARVNDANNCFVIDSLLMKTQHPTCLEIRNAFSPNGDNINDVWNIGKIELYPNAEVIIYNRWGEPVWRSARGYPQPWDGRGNGVSLPIDSYYYIIDLHNGTRPVSGNVTIIK